MTPFFKQSMTRALCAAAWGLPGALWWATPMVAETRDSSWVIFALPQEGWICGNALRDFGFRRSHAMRSAVARGEYADSLVSIANNPRKEADSREWARVRLIEMGDPRAPRRADTSPLHAIELPPLIVGP